MLACVSMCVSVFVYHKETLLLLLLLPSSSHFSYCCHGDRTSKHKLLHLPLHLNLKADDRLNLSDLFLSAVTLKKPGVSTCNVLILTPPPHDEGDDDDEDKKQQKQEEAADPQQHIVCLTACKQTVGLAVCRLIVCGLTVCGLTVRGPTFYKPTDC